MVVIKSTTRVHLAKWSHGSPIGHPQILVQDRLGHTPAQVTMETYTHHWPESDDSTREAVGAVLGKSALSDLCQAEA